MIRYVITSGAQQVIVSDHFAANVIAEQLAGFTDAGHATVREEVMTRGKWQPRNTHTVMHTWEQADYSVSLGDFDA